MRIPIRRLDADLPLPAAQHPDDAGYDLHAREDMRIDAAGGRAVVPTGVAVAIPAGYAGFVLPRSGLALRHGVTCLNTPGLIDPLYRGARTHVFSDELQRLLKSDFISTYTQD